MRKLRKIKKVKRKKFGTIIDVTNTWIIKFVDVHLNGLLQEEGINKDYIIEGLYTIHFLQKLKRGDTVTTKTKQIYKI